MIPLFRPVINGPEAIRLQTECYTSGYTGEGPKCVELEAKLEKLLGMRVLLTNSGTTALKLAFMSAGVTRAGQSEVITTPSTCLATPMAAIDSGAKLVWADVDPETGNINPEDAANKATSRTVAICPVDWAGHLCNFQRLRELTRGVSIVEDAAHAFLATRQPGGRGDYVAFSFQSIKHLSMADGGALACPGETAYADVREDRWFGLDRTRGDSMRCHQRAKRIGIKGQSNDVSAALGLANLSVAVEAVQRCRETAAWYRERIGSLRHVKTPRFDPGASYWMYQVKVSNPIWFENHMRQRGVEAGQVHSRCDMHPCFSDAKGGENLPGVDEFFAHQSHLPAMPHVTDAGREVVWKALEEWDRSPSAVW